MNVKKVILTKKDRRKIQACYLKHETEAGGVKNKSEKRSVCNFYVYISFEQGLFQAP